MRRSSSRARSSPRRTPRRREPSSRCGRSRCPTRSRRSPVLRSEVRTAAIAAAGGVLAGAATVAAVRAVSARRLRKRSPAPPRAPPRAPRQRRRQPLLPGRRPPARTVSAEAGLGRSSSRSRPPSPFRLPRYGGEDRVLRVARRRRHAPAARRGQPGPGPRLAAGAGPGRAARRAGRPGAVAAAAAGARARRAPGRARPSSSSAIERMRFALGVDDDLGEFYRRFRRDPLLGPLLRRRPYLRPRRRPWPWEALAWAVVKQLIETGRAARIQRRIVGRWGPRLGRGPRRRCATCPRAALIAGRAPAELESMGLAAEPRDRPARGRPRGRRRPLRSRRARPPTARLLAVREIGPWTVQCLGLFGRGDPDSLPAGDLDLPEAGRPPRRPRPPRDGRGGRGVLRAVRAVPRPRRRAWTDRLCSRAAAAPRARASRRRRCR